MKSPVLFGVPVSRSPLPAAVLPFLVLLLPFTASFAGDTRADVVGDADTNNNGQLDLDELEALAESNPRMHDNLQGFCAMINDDPAAYGIVLPEGSNKTQRRCDDKLVAAPSLQVWVEQRHAPAAVDPVAHWSFDDCDGKNSVSKKHTGTLEGKKKCVERPLRDDETSTALTFRKGKGRMVVADSPELSAGEAFTVALKVKNEGGGVLVQHGGVCPDGAPKFLGRSYTLEINEAGHVTFDVSGGSGNYDDPVHRVTSRAVLPQDDGWHGVRAVADQGELTLYIDGKKDSATTTYLSTGGSDAQEKKEPQFTSIADSADIIQIGAGYGYCGKEHTPLLSPFPGGIDEVKLFSAAQPPGLKSSKPVADTPTQRAIEAGPLWNQGHAAKTCPKVCKKAGGSWEEGRMDLWYTTVPNKMSVCLCDFK